MRSITSVPTELNGLKIIYMDNENKVITISINVRLNDEGRSVRELFFNGLLLRSETSVNGYINPEDPVSRLIRFVIDGYGKKSDNQ